MILTSKYLQMKKIYRHFIEIFLLIKNDIHEPTLLNIISYYSEYCSDVFPWTKLANNHLKNIASISAMVTENV